jgi:bifunctional enzyme CysN/CysC
VLAVNKMDLVDWSEDRFRAIETEFMALARRLRFDGATAIPVSAREGANVARASDAMPWYRGRTLLGHLSQIPSRGTYTEGDFRFPVQLVLREGVDFRGLAGTVASGSARIGDEIEDSTSGRTARISRIVTMDGDRDAARAGDAVVLELDSDLDISRGSVLGRRGAMPIRSEKLSARLVWLSDVPLEPGHGTLLRTATDTVRVANFEVTTRLDLDTLTEVQHGESKTSDVLVADISVERPIALDRFADIKQTGGFLLVHALTGDTLACGVVVAAREALKPRRSRAFRVTEAMLARDICAGLEPGSKEFRRRADAVLRLLAEAGVSAEMEMEMEMESGGGI